MFYLKAVLLSLLLLSSCFRAGERTENEYEIKKTQDEDRDEVIERTSRTITGDKEKCEDKAKSHDCYEYCDDMFRTNRDEDDCEELTVAQVSAMWDLYELLEDPDAEEDIDPESFDLYVNISIRSLDDLIGKYNSRDAKEFLIWLIENEEIAKIFKKEDDEHKSFEALLKKFSGSYSSSNHDISTPFLKKLERDKLLEESMGSEWMLEWFQEYINEKNNACKSDTETRACFAVYCKIGNGIDDNARDDWMDFDDFESYIEDIIDEKINSRQGTGNNRNTSGWIHETAAGSSNNEIEDTGDLENWVDDLCQGLTGGTTTSGGGGSGGGSGGGGNSGNNNNQPAQPVAPQPPAKSPPQQPPAKSPPQQPVSPPQQPLNLPSLCNSVSTETACINRLLSSTDVPRSSITLNNSKETLVWIFSTKARAKKFLKQAKASSTKYLPFEKFLYVYRYARTSFDPTSSNIFIPFITDLKSNKNLMELALDTNTANYIINYISSRSVCSNDLGRGVGITNGCFTLVYCFIAEQGQLSVVDLKKWFNTPNFKTYLKKWINIANGGAGELKKNIVRRTLKAGLPDPLSIGNIKNNWKTGLCR